MLSLPAAHAHSELLSSSPEADAQLDTVPTEVVLTFSEPLQAQLSVVSRVKQAYYRLAFAYAQTEVLDRNLDLLRRFVKISEIRYSVGKAEQQDVLKAQTQVSILETRRIPLEQEKRAREAEINSLLHRRANSPLGRRCPASSCIGAGTW